MHHIESTDSGQSFNYFMFHILEVELVNMQLKYNDPEIEKAHKRGCQKPLNVILSFKKKYILILSDLLYQSWHLASYSYVTLVLLNLF